jgi:hypothetical protein
MEEAQKKKILRQRVKEAEKAQKEAERKLAIANKTIFDQMMQIEKLNKFIDFKETEARLQDNAIDRNNTIIHYLESKIVSIISDFNKA